MTNTTTPTTPTTPTTYQRLWKGVIYDYYGDAAGAYICRHSDGWTDVVRGGHLVVQMHATNPFVGLIGAIALALATE